jgi:proteasome assembly chaperone 3
VPATIALAETSSDDLGSDATGSTLPPVHPSIDLTYLFGNAPSPDQQTLYSSYAAQIATLVWTSEQNGQIGTSRNPVVVGIALKPPLSSERPSGTDRATYLQVMDLVRDALNTACTT